MCSVTRLVRTEEEEWGQIQGLGKVLHSMLEILCAFGVALILALGKDLLFSMLAAALPMRLPRHSRFIRRILGVTNSLLHFFLAL